MTPDILSQDEIDRLLSATGDEDSPRDLTHNVNYKPEFLKRRIDNYNFQPGQKIFVNWPDEHPFQHDSFFGHIIEVGEKTFYLGVHKNDKVRRIRANSRQFALPEEEATALRALYDQEVALNLGVPFETGHRLLLEGFALNPEETGFGLAPSFESIPRLFKNQLPGQLLLELDYLKATYAYVGIDDDIEMIVHDSLRVPYLSLINGKPGSLLEQHRDRISGQEPYALDAKVKERLEALTS